MDLLASRIASIYSRVGVDWSTCYLRQLKAKGAPIFSRQKRLFANHVNPYGSSCYGLFIDVIITLVFLLLFKKLLAMKDMCHILWLKVCTIGIGIVVHKIGGRYPDFLFTPFFFFLNFWQECFRTEKIGAPLAFTCRGMLKIKSTHLLI